MSDTPPAPPGWYEYSPGIERWWDGSAWTEDMHLAEPQKPGAIPLAETATARPPSDGDTRPWWDYLPSVRYAAGLLVTALLVSGYFAYDYWDKHRERDTAYIESEIETYVDDSYEDSDLKLGASSADCPDTADQSSGSTFDCIVTFADDTTSASVEVKFQNNSGEYVMQLQP